MPSDDNVTVQAHNAVPNKRQGWCFLILKYSAHSQTPAQPSLLSFVVHSSTLFVLVADRQPLTSLPIIDADCMVVTQMISIWSS